MEIASFLEDISFFFKATVSIQVPVVFRSSDKMPVINKTAFASCQMFMLQIPHLMLFTVMGNCHSLSDHKLAAAISLDV